MLGGSSIRFCKRYSDYQITIKKDSLVSQVDSTSDPTRLFSHSLDDHEYNGALNQAAAQGAKFALLLAMLEQNSLLRPGIASDDDQAPDYYQTQLALLSHYRTPALAADDSYWSKVMATQHYIQQGETANARLWLTLHPEPLSLRNDAHFIDEEVIENCALAVRQRLQHAQAKRFKQDASILYDILQKVNPQHSAA